MAASGRGVRSSIAGGWRICKLDTWLIVLLRGWKEEFARSMVEAMANRGHLAPDYRYARRLLGRSQGGRGGARPNMEGEDLGEN